MLLHLVVGPVLNHSREVLPSQVYNFYINIVIQ